MIILWNWKELKAKNNAKEKLQLDEVYIAKDDSCKIIRIDDKLAGDHPVRIRNAISKQLELLDASDEAIIFLHDGSIEEKEIRVLKEEVDKMRYRQSNLYSRVKFEKFGGGKSFIYFNSSRDTGLLQNKHFPAGKIVQTFKDPVTGEEIRKRVSILTPTGKIIPKYFHKVWNYYRHSLKEFLFELKENLYIYLLENRKFEQAKGITLFKFVNKEDHFLKEVIQDLLQQSLWHLKIEESYGSKRAAIINQYDELAGFIETTTLHSDYLINMRTRFDTLLQTMDEKIYA